MYVCMYESGHIYIYIDDILDIRCLTYEHMELYKEADRESADIGMEKNDNTNYPHAFLSLSFKHQALNSSP